MRALENIEVGQEVVFGDEVRDWRIGKIIKITKTSFTVQPENYNGTVRFNKRDGWEWGSGDRWSYHFDKIRYSSYVWNSPFMTRQQMEAKQATQKENDTRYRIARLITETRTGNLAEEVSLADLTKAAQLLGVSLEEGDV